MTGSWGELEPPFMFFYPSNIAFCSIGPKDLTNGTLSPDNTTVIPTVTDSLFEQGTIKQNLVAVSFEPLSSGSVQNGELRFGSIDRGKYTGYIQYL